MTLAINQDCINCNLCVAECPHAAIADIQEDDSPLLKHDGVHFVIKTDNCTECVGAHEQSQCVAVCPADAIQPIPGTSDRAMLERKAERLGAFFATLGFPPNLHEAPNTREAIQEDGFGPTPPPSFMPELAADLK